LNRKLTVGSLFAGIGGFDLGLERAGMEVAWQCEIDPFCQQVLKKHWPDVPLYSDVTELSFPPRVDVLVGGFPCQDISNAGTTHEGGLTGLEGKRSGLWNEFYRIICEVQPRWVVIENVGALTVRGLDRVLWQMADGGFNAEWSVLSSGALGAPHLRKRLFIVARRVIRFLDEMEPVSGEPWCPECQEWYVECSHHGPHSWHDSVLSDPDREGLEGHVGSVLAQPDDWRSNADAARLSWWGSKAGVRRDADGLPVWMDGSGPVIFAKGESCPNRKQRLQAVGNTVQPQVVEWIGRRIIQSENDSLKVN